jgi:CubicO group peptidase (beta-lactamase class C family)
MSVRFDHMHELLAGYITRKEIPGLVAAVAHDGDVHIDAIGSMALDDKRPMRRDSIFRIASMSKPVIAAGVMALVEDGTLTLDEPAQRRLPELANRRVLCRVDAELDETEPAVRPITIRDLLTYTWGFGIPFVAPRTYPIQRAMDDLQLNQGIPEPTKFPAPDEWMRRLGTLPLMYQPGARWMYNTGSDVQGVLIARASGMSLETYLRTRIFEPLGMQDTGFSVPSSKLDRLTTSYIVDPLKKGLAVFDPPNGQWSTPPAFPAGGGGMVSTAEDYLAFGEMILGRGTRGAVRVLSQQSVDEMTRGHLTSSQRAASNDFANYFVEHTWGYGMGIVTGHDGAGGPGTVGWDGGLGSAWRADPNTKTVTVLLTQRAMTSPAPPPVFRDFWRSVREGIAIEAGR